MPRFSLLIFYLLLQARAIQPQAQVATRSTLEGIVTRSDNGAPIEGVQVTAVAANIPGVTTTFIPSTLQPVTTGLDGRFRFQNVMPAAYRVTASARDMFLSNTARSPRSGWDGLFM
jgi:hypothetical protein